MASEPQPITIGRADDKDGGEVLSPRAAVEAVRAAVASWEGVTTHDHRWGGLNSDSVAENWVTCIEPSPTCPSRAASATSSSQEDGRDPTMSFLSPVG